MKRPFRISDGVKRGAERSETDQHGFGRKSKTSQTSVSVCVSLVRIQTRVWRASLCADIPQGLLLSCISINCYLSQNIGTVPNVLIFYRPTIHCAVSRHIILSPSSSIKLLSQ